MGCQRPRRGERAKATPTQALGHIGPQRVVDEESVDEHDWSPVVWARDPVMDPAGLEVDGPAFCDLWPRQGIPSRSSSEWAGRLSVAFGVPLAAVSPACRYAGCPPERNDDRVSVADKCGVRRGSGRMRHRSARQRGNVVAPDQASRGGVVCLRSRLGLDQDKRRPPWPDALAWGDSDASVNAVWGSKARRRRTAPA
jgi:hypothetical protein